MSRLRAGPLLGVLTLLGCGGEVDSSAVVTADGESRSADAIYDPPPSGAAGRIALGTLDLRQVDASHRLTTVRLDFREDGRLVVLALGQRMTYDDEHGDRLEDVTLQVGGGRRTCTLHDRWRTMGDRRLGLLFTCSDGVAREVVLVAASALRRPSAADVHWTARLELEAVGSDPVSPDDPRSPWGLYRFGLSTP